MKEYTLTRTGDRPLQFSGECIAAADGKYHAGQEQNRWHEMSVYRTMGGKYVVEVAYRTQWQGEEAHYRAAICETIEEVITSLRSIDPTAHLQGFPPHPSYAEKQTRLKANLRLQLDVLISEVFDSLPEAVERVE
ncbi:MAG: hypothetical protein KGZ53_03630 [Peptococcaceae bacterium]|nr:hypothetical protein [Peptococcaceae bacterium]